jgi:D-galactarolactone cycloisomerase
MKIARVESILINLPFQAQSRSGGRLALAGMDTLFVRVDTDEGLTGWGEAFGFRLCPATRIAVETLIAPLCIGRDPTDITSVMRDLQYRMHNYGRNGPAMFGLAGINIALWDIAGQIVGLPLYRLLGGAPRTHVPAYASLWRYGSADAVRRNVEKALARGYRELKLHEIESAIVLAAREAAGPIVPFTLDVNCAWTAREAIEMTQRLEGMNIRWIEEPTWPPEDFAALAEVNKNGALPVAAGENIATPIEFSAMFRQNAVAFAQPSVAKIGVSATREVAALAATPNVALAPHSPYFGPGLIATMHIAAAAGGDVAVERYFCDLEPGPLGDAINAVGDSFVLPNRPGLGLEIDETLLARYRVS